MKKYLSLLVAIAVMMMSFAGCGEKMAVSEGEIVDFAINEMGNEVEDSSDLPDWKGKKLELEPVDQLRYGYAYVKYLIGNSDES